uniref:Arachidonate 12-lipoxygenase n=1 Tax=Hippocampus comes TaxID=109280 RepID=A0A3Q3DQU9_HIPCM
MENSALYTVTVATDTLGYVGTSNYIYLTLVGDKGQLLTFPCYRWFVGDQHLPIFFSLAKIQSHDSSALLQAHRGTDLEDRQAIYSSSHAARLTIRTQNDLLQDVRFDNGKRSDFEHLLKKLAINFGKTWDDLERISWELQSPLHDDWMQWKEDCFFGYGCLNGFNPRMIRTCKTTEGNFPVTAFTAQNSFPKGSNRDKEPQVVGNVFSLEDTIMDWIPTNAIKGQLQNITGPLCLLNQHPDGVPLYAGWQSPTNHIPSIFLTKDPPFLEFQVLSHMLIELDIERNSLWVNLQFYWSFRYTHDLTYRSLHHYLDFIDRGVSQLPKYFYQSDKDVHQDAELQPWIRDVTQEGLAELPDFGQLSTSVTHTHPYTITRRCSWDCTSLEGRAKEPIGTFTKGLEQIEGHVFGQNEGWELAYFFLLPSCVENSITVEKN